MLFPNGSVRYDIPVDSFPGSRVILDQLSTWDLDTMTLNRKIPEHSSSFIKYDYWRLTMFLASKGSYVVKQV